jgi:signal transduction histidine kinase
MQSFELQGRVEPRSTFVRALATRSKDRKNVHCSGLERVNRPVTVDTPGSYTVIVERALIWDITQCVGFGAEDHRRLRALAPVARPFIPQVVNAFYDRLLTHPTAAAVFTGGTAQVDRLRETLADWLSDVLGGTYDQEYFNRRLRIGMMHVNVGLPQHFMVTGIHLVREEMAKHLSEAKLPELGAFLVSFDRILSLDLAIILQSYQEGHAEQVRTTERHAVKEQLTRAEHLAEIGRLAASLAHEIKNPLAGMSGAIQIIRGEMLPDDPHRPILQEILGQIGRLDATVKDLLLYARPTPPRAAPLVLGDVVGRVLNILREEPSLQKVRITQGTFAADALVRADDTQMEQLIMNLLLNAAHASPEGGTIHIGVSRQMDRVRLTVADHGVGMSEDVRGRAFEPFYTTKTKGTGLGLSICRRIVDAHDGIIELQSRPGAGTRVIVDLPLHRVGEDRREVEMESEGYAE